MLKYFKKNKIIFYVTGLLGLSLLQGCFNDPKYQPTAYYTTQGYFYKEKQQTQYPDYSFYLNFINSPKQTQGQKLVEFYLTTQTQKDNPIVEAYLDRAYLEVNGQKYPAITKENEDDEVVFNFEKIQATGFNVSDKKKVVFENPNLPFHSKINSKTEKDIVSKKEFFVVIPVKVQMQGNQNSEEKTPSNFRTTDVKIKFEQRIESGQRIIPSWYSAH